MKYIFIIVGAVVGLLIGWVVIERYLIQSTVTEPVRCPSYLQDLPQKGCEK